MTLQLLHSEFPEILIFSFISVVCQLKHSSLPDKIQEMMQTRAALPLVQMSPACKGRQMA
jgi:hypothetical protein